MGRQSWDKWLCDYCGNSIDTGSTAMIGAWVGFLIGFVVAGILI